VSTATSSAATSGTAASKVPPPYELPALVRFGALAVVVAFALLFPLIFPNPAVTTIAIFALMFTLAVSGWNIFSGYSGYIALGGAVFYGVGQYTSALLIIHLNVTPGWAEFYLLPVAGIVAVVVSVPLGWLLLRVRKHTFIVLTIASMFIFQLFAFNWRGLTGGSQGLTVPQPLWQGSYFNQPFYYVTLGAAAVAIAASWSVRRSKFGLGLLAIRDDEDRARSLGVNTRRTKLVGFAISAFFLGMAGAIYAPFVGSVFPQFAFDPTFDLAMAVMAFTGGLGTIVGPALGAVFIESSQQYFQLQYGQDNVFLLIYGALFVLVLRFLPDGIVPSLSRRWRERVAARASAAAAPPTTGPTAAVPISSAAEQGELLK